jgi:hypothetical protein
VSFRANDSVGIEIKPGFLMGARLGAEHEYRNGALQWIARPEDMRRNIRDVNCPRYAAVNDDQLGWQGNRREGGSTERKARSAP